MLQVKQRNKKENLAWEDKNNYFSSTYTEFHVKNLTPGQKIEGGFSKDELRKHTTELQASHLVFGSEDNDFGTSHANNFKNKSAKAEKAGPPIDLMKTNFYPGDDPIPTESLYKHYHKQMPIIKAALNEELKKDLRGKLLSHRLSHSPPLQIRRREDQLRDRPQKWVQRVRSYQGRQCRRQSPPLPEPLPARR